MTYRLIDRPSNRHNAALGLLLSAGLALSPLAPSQAAPGPEAPTPGLPGPTIRVALEADVSELGELGHGLGKKMIEQLQDDFEAAGIEVVGVGEPADVALRIRIRVLESDEWDYGLHFEFVGEDKKRTRSAIDWFDCHLCVDARMFPRLDAVAPDLIAAIEREVASMAEVGDSGDNDGSGDTEGGGSSDSGEDSDTGEDPDGGSEPPPPKPKPIGALGFAGVAGLALGTGLGIAGVVELPRGVALGQSDATPFLDEIDHRTPGLVLLGVGAAVFVAGAVMLGIDVGTRAKKRRPDTARLPTVSPLVGRITGLGVAGKF